LGKAGPWPAYGRCEIITIAMRYHVEAERETDGRWLAEVVELPGAMAYGETQDAAVAGAKAVALHIIADRIEHGEASGGPTSISFAHVAPAAE
jgi:predicted RNase H-like HicB family nuclease